MITNEHGTSDRISPTTKVEIVPVREEREAADDTQPAKRPGLCVSCMHRLGCQYRKANAQPVIYCEEFEVEETPPRPVRRSSVEQADPETTGSLKGLCMNCAHRETCRLPKPDGGVWHCEEYE